jgi:hypothetical protein
VLRGGQTDALLVLWTTLGLYGLVRHLTAGPAWGWYGVASVAMGLGVLTKGVGFLPLFLLVPYVYGRRRRTFRGLTPISPRNPRWLIGPAVLLATVAAWLGPLLVRVAASGDRALHDYARNLMFTQTVERMLAATQHRQPVWYFVLKVIPVVWLPVVASWPWLIPVWRRRLARGDGRLLLLIGWAGLVVAFFSLSSGKRALYIYPALPALVLAAGAPTAALSRRLARKPKYWRTAAMGAVAWFLLLIAWGVAEPFVGARHYPRRVVMAGVAHRIGPDRELALIHRREGQWLFARNPIVHFGYRAGPDQLERALTWLRERQDRWLLADERRLGDCFDLTRAIHVGRDRGRTLYLVDARADTGRCAGHPIRRLFRFRWERSDWPRRRAAVLRGRTDGWRTRRPYAPDIERAYLVSRSTSFAHASDDPLQHPSSTPPDSGPLRGMAAGRQGPAVLTRELAAAVRTRPDPGRRPHRPRGDARPARRRGRAHRAPHNARAGVIAGPEG